MVAVDTNLLLRLMTADDAKQQATAMEFISRGAWVSHVVLMEVAWVLGSAYGLPDNSIADALDGLLNHAQLVTQEPDVVQGAISLYRRRPTLRFADCLILETARKAGHLPLGTFDRELGKLDGAKRL